MELIIPHYSITILLIKVLFVLFIAYSAYRTVRNYLNGVVHIGNRWAIATIILMFMATVFQTSTGPKLALEVHQNNAERPSVSTTVEGTGNWRTQDDIKDGKTFEGKLLNEALSK